MAFNHDAYMDNVEQKLRARFTESAEDERVANESGGLQSKLKIDYSYLDWSALAVLAGVMTENAQEYGGKYPRGNWKKIPALDHWRHAMYHMAAAMENDGQEDIHTFHAFARLMMLTWCIAENGESLHG